MRINSLDNRRQVQSPKRLSGAVDIKRSLEFIKVCSLERQAPTYLANATRRLEKLKSVALKVPP